MKYVDIVVRYIKSWWNNRPEDIRLAMYLYVVFLIGTLAFILWTLI